MKKELGILFAIITVSFLLVGCSQGTQEQNQAKSPSQASATKDNPNQAESPVGNTQNSQTSPSSATATASTSASITKKTLAMDKLYNYGMVTSFEYKISSTTAGQTAVSNMKYTMGSETLNGAAAWKMTNEVTAQGANILMTEWLDKTTYKCLKIASVINVQGQKIEQPSECPKEGPNSASRIGTTAPVLEYLGDESVTVPAGTYNAEKYNLEGTTYWYASSVPVPVKVTYSTGTTVMELVSFS